MRVFTDEEEKKILAKCVEAGFFAEQQAQRVREELALGEALPDVIAERKLLTRETFITVASRVLGIPPAEIEGKGRLAPEGRQG